jgi:hypothetical protein
VGRVRTLGSHVQEREEVGWLGLVVWVRTMMGWDGMGCTSYTFLFSLLEAR